MKLIIIMLAALALPATAGAAGAVTPAQRAALFPELERAAHISEGAASPKAVLYVMFDANCYYCNLTWRALQAYEKAGLQVRWVPVAYQKDSSYGRAAAMLAARDPAAALRINETRYRAKSYDGGLQPLAVVTPAQRAQLDANTRLMERLGAPGTPAVVWKDGKGDIGFINGVPRLSELPRITGLPLQKIDDPELAEFR